MAMKRLWASVVCLAFVFAALAHVTAFATDATGDRASVAALASSSTGDSQPTCVDIDRPGCAGETGDSVDACAIDAVISALSTLAPAPVRRPLAGGREAAPLLKMSVLAPEPPPPIALS